MAREMATFRLRRPELAEVMVACRGWAVSAAARSVGALRWAKGLWAVSDDSALCESGGDRFERWGFETPWCEVSGFGLVVAMLCVRRP